MTALAALAVASIAFVGTHFLMSHRFGGHGASAGRRGFSITYSIVSLVTFYAMVHFYHPAFAQSPAVAWDAGATGWIIGTLLMWLGSILFIGRFGETRLSDGWQAGDRDWRARGVFAITRHPMMWGFAIWALVHGDR